MRNKLFLISITVLLLLTSCVSKPKADSSGINFSGSWKNNTMSVFYSVYMHGGKFIRITYSKKDTTYNWEAYASENELSLDEVIQKKYAALTKIYGIDYPLADENETNHGIMVTTNKTNTRVYESEIWYIPEEIILQNKSCFKLSRNKKNLLIDGYIDLNSSVFDSFYIHQQLKRNK